MAITPSPLPGTSSEVRLQFLQPLRAVYDQATTIRNCPAQSDWDWLTKGVDRVLSNSRTQALLRLRSLYAKLLQAQQDTNAQRFF